MVSRAGRARQALGRTRPALRGSWSAPSTAPDGPMRGSGLLLSIPRKHAGKFSQALLGTESELGRGGQGTGMESTLITMSTEQRTEVWAHRRVHLKLM